MDCSAHLPSVRWNCGSCNYCNCNCNGNSYHFSRNCNCDCDGNSYQYHSCDWNAHGDWDSYTHTYTIKQALSFQTEAWSL